VLDRLEFKDFKVIEYLLKLVEACPHDTATLSPWVRRMKAYFHISALYDNYFITYSNLVFRTYLDLPSDGNGIGLSLDYGKHRAQLLTLTLSDWNLLAANFFAGRSRRQYITLE